MAGDGAVDPRMMHIQPRIRYNTIGGINGPLVILDNVGRLENHHDLDPKLIWLLFRSNSPDSTRSSP